MVEWQLVESAAIYPGTAGAETASRRLYFGRAAIYPGIAGAVTASRRLYLRQGGDLSRHSRGGNGFAPALLAAERRFIPAQPGR